MNSIWKSFTDVWEGLSGGQRMTLIGSVALTIALLAGVVMWSQKPQLSPLFASMDPTEAGKISDVLRDQKIPFEITNGGHTILVPSDRVYELRMTVISKGLSKSGGSGSVGFELFDKQTFGLSDFLQRANYYRALQGEFERTIGSMEEVEKARVIIVAPNDRLFSTEKNEVKASVFLTLRGTLQKHQVNAVRFLVANGVEGLKPGRVSVTDQAGHVLAENEDESTAGMSSSQMEIRKNLETLYVNKVQGMLDQVLGVGGSAVRVTVDMNFDTVQQTEEKFDPTASVIRTETISTEESVTPVRASGGSVASTASTNAVSTVTSETMKGTAKKQNTNNQYEISKLVQNTLKGSGEIKKISVAVCLNIPSPIPEGGGAPAPKPYSKEELDSFEKLIKKSVGFVAEGKGKRNDDFELTQFAFKTGTEAEKAAAVKAAAPSIMDKVAGFIPWIKQGAWVALAAVLLIYFRKMMSSIQSTQLKEDLSIDAMMRSEEMAAPKRSTGAPISVGDLSKLIRENPSNMGQALKNWISQAQ